MSDSPPATRPDDWHTARVALTHLVHPAPNSRAAYEDVRAMLARGQAAEAERDALLGYVRAIDERAALVDDDCACVICQAYRALPETVRARLEATHE